MKTLTQALMVALAFVLMPAPVVGQSMADVAEGATLYGQHCIRCHTARSPTERSNREWVTIVNHMRARANLLKSQAYALRVFLQTTNGFGEPVVTTASAPAQPSQANPASRIGIRTADGLVVVDLSDPRLPPEALAALERYLARIKAGEGS